MAWIVQPRQLRDGGRWRLVAESDEGGGFHEACEGHDHATPDEASACPLGQSAADVITGIPVRILAKAEREDGCVVSVGGLVTDMDELAALRAQVEAYNAAAGRDADELARLRAENERLKEQVTRLQEASTAELLRHREEKAEIAAKINGLWIRSLDSVWLEMNSGATFVNPMLAASARRFLMEMEARDARS